MPQLTEIKALPDYKLFLKFSDGVMGKADVSDIVGKGVFEKWNDYKFFENVWIGENGAPTWEDELDIDSLNLYLQIIGKTFEEYTNQNKKVA